MVFIPRFKISSFFGHFFKDIQKISYLTNWWRLDIRFGEIPSAKVRSLSRRSGAFLNNEFNTSLIASESELSVPTDPNSLRRMSATASLKGAVPLPPKVSPTEPIAGTWFYVSDSHVVEVTEAKVLKAQAYLLFYERIY